MKKFESHKHFILGENKQWFPEYDFIIHLNEPRCFIKYNSDLAMFASFEQFYSNIAEVQWLDGAPSQELIHQTLIDAWNFLSIEDRILEDDLSDVDDEDEY
jgi:hypothetical protein